MGTNTLNTRNSGDTILANFFNDFNTALEGDFIGRNTSGVPTSGQNLGTVAVPWGSIYGGSVVINGSAIDSTKIVSPVNRIISGKTRSASNQPAFLTPNGAALSFIVAGLTKSLSLDINGTAVSVSTNITKGSLTAAPSSQNTCLVNDTDASGQHDTRLWGEPEHYKKIVYDTAGTNITNLVGKYAAFKIGGEYFLAYVESTTVLSKCKRGFFYDSSLNPTNRSTFSNNDTITLMKIGWIFMDQDSTTVDVTYTNPTWSFTSPSSPSTGDYWYDLANKMWKRYDGASFVIINRVMIGMFVNDSANCVAARCVDFYAAYDHENELDIEVSTSEIAIATKEFASVNVAGSILKFEQTRPQWNITTDLVGSADMYSATEQASRLYYLYIRDDGKTVISDISPYYRDDLFGEYHPHNPWRCVGLMFNDASSNIAQAGAIKLQNSGENEIQLDTSNGYGAVNVYVGRYTNSRLKGCFATYVDSVNSGASFTVAVPGMYLASITDFGNPTYTGVSVNGDGTSQIYNGANSSIMVIGYATSNNLNTAARQRYCRIGEVLRPHFGATSTRGSSGYDGNVTITKIA